MLVLALQVSLLPSEDRGLSSLLPLVAIVENSIWFSLLALNILPKDLGDHLASALHWDHLIFPLTIPPQHSISPLILEDGIKKQHFSSV